MLRGLARPKETHSFRAPGDENCFCAPHLQQALSGHRQGLVITNGYARRSASFVFVRRYQRRVLIALIVLPLRVDNQPNVFVCGEFGETIQQLWLNDPLTVIRYQDAIEAAFFPRDEPADFLQSRICDWGVIFTVQTDDLLMTWTSDDSCFLNGVNFSIGKYSASGCADALEISD